MLFGTLEKENNTSRGKRCFFGTLEKENHASLLKSAFMSSYNVKIQFDSVENLLKCETMYCMYVCM
jgi:hypothetical protein